MADWFEGLPDTLTVEHNGAQIPLKAHPFVKESPDLAVFTKRAFDTHRESGSRIPIKITNDSEREAWRREHLPKLYQAGVLPAPADKPEAYFVKPAQMPQGLTWNDNLAKEVGVLLHQHGVPAVLGPALSEIWMGAQQRELKAVEDGMKAELDGIDKQLRERYKDQYDVRLESAKRLAKQVMRDSDTMVFDPDLLPVFMALGPMAEQDSSFLKDVIIPSSSNQATGEAAWKEYQDIIGNKDNPKNKLFYVGDKATVDYVDSLAKRAFPGERNL